MDTDSFYLVMSGDSLDEIVRPEINRRMRLTRKIGSRQKNLVRGHPVYLSLSLQAQQAYGLLQSATLFIMRPMKINIAA